MKLYIDLSCDKVSGQQNMQRALRNYTKQLGLYAEKEDADILVYVQVPFENNIVDEWRHWKELGKKIVFIHHYMSKSFYERCAVFKIEGLFELIDKHVVISKEAELYQYLLDRGIKESNIYVQELAAAEYNDIYKNYFKIYSEKHTKIAFVGKAIKGVDKFVDFLTEHKITNHVILCPDAQKCAYDLTNYRVYTDRTYDGVYEILSDCKFFYCPSVYNTPTMHLETSLLEAMACGCIPVVDDSYKKILNTDDVSKYGLILDTEFDNFDTKNGREYQRRVREFYVTHFMTLTQTLQKLTNKLLTFF